MGKTVNVRGPGLQNVLLCHVEPSPLKTMGFPVSPLTSLHAVSRELDPCWPPLPWAPPAVPPPLFLPLPGTISQASEWLPPSTPFRSLTHITPSQWFFLLLYFTLQTHSKYSPSPFSVLFYPQHWSLLDSLLSFLSDQCKKIEENNRMGKTRDLFKKIRDTKGTFHAKMGLIKDRNGMDLTEAEDIRKRWQEYTEELYKKDLHDPHNHDGVITHLEPDILECKVKWALGSITMNKARGGDGITAELFKILKHDAVKLLHSICQQIWKTQQWPQDWKRSVFIPIPKKGNAEECPNYDTIALISHDNKVMLKILQARLQKHVNRELPDVQAGFRKGRGTRDQIANILWIIKKAREFQKNIYVCFIDYAKVWLCGLQ